MAKRIETEIATERDAESGLAAPGAAGVVTGALWLFTVVCAVLALISYLVLRDLNDRSARLAQAVAAEQALGRQAVRSAEAVVHGDAGAAIGLRNERDRLAQGLAALADGAPAALAAPVGAARDAGRGYGEALDRILAAQDDLAGLRAARATTTELLGKLAGSMADAALLVVAEGVSAEEALAVGRQLARIETMKADVTALLASGSATVADGDAGQQVLGAFGVSLDDLIAQAATRPDSAAAPVLAETSRLFNGVLTAINPLPPLVSRTLAVNDALASMQLAADQFAAALDGLTVAAGWGPRVVRVGPLPLGSGAISWFSGLALVGLLLIAGRPVLAARWRAAAGRDQPDPGESAGMKVHAPPGESVAGGPGAAAVPLGGDLLPAGDLGAARRNARLAQWAQELVVRLALVDELADQARVLALNAALQASLAGEAGGGFAVVGDEAERLAEHLRHAAAQLAVLVGSIQADTHEAAGAGLAWAPAGPAVAALSSAPSRA